MTSIALPTRLPPLSQLDQLCTSLMCLLGDIAESADSAFRRVHTTKTNPDGTLRIYEKKETVVDSVTGERSVIVKQSSVFIGIEDVKTGEIYMDEGEYGECVVAVKCALVALGLPFYVFGKMGWHAIKTLIDIGVIACEALVKVGEQCILGRLYEASNESRYAVTQACHVFGMGLFEIIKAPLFALGCELAAIYGIFKPYHGRKFEAIIENAWQKGASYKEDMRFKPERANEDDWTAFKNHLRDAHTYYLANCFQVRGNVNDPRVTVLRRESIR